MAFPTIPTEAAGRVAGLNQLNTVTILSSVNLNTLTKSPGDLLIAIAGEYQSNAGADAAFINWAGGGLTWTEIRDSTGTANNRLGVAIARVVTGSETGTVTVTRSGTLVGDASMILLVIPGAHDTTNPEATVMATATNGAAVPASLSPSWGAEDTLWIAVNGNGMTSATGSWTANNSAPTNYTDFFGTNPADTSTIGDFGTAVAFRQLNAASEAFDGFGQDTNNARSAALLIAVRPVPAAPPTIDGDATLEVTAGRDVDAIKILNADTTSAVTAGLDATANTIQVSTATVAATVDIVADAEIVAAIVEADAICDVTVGLSADAAKILNGDAISAITAGITADAAKILNGNATRSAIVDIIADANSTQIADATTAITVSVTADADVIVPGGTIHEADATTAVTAAITAAAAKILDGDTTIPATASITADAQVLGTVLADAALDVTAATTATANLIAAVDTTLATAVTITADASVILAATADMATTVTVIADGDIPPEVTRGQVSGRHRPLGTTTGWTRLLAAVSARTRPMPTVSGG